MNKKATIERLEVQDGIWIEQMQHNLERTKKDADANKVERFAQMKAELTRVNQDFEAEKARTEVRKRELVRLNAGKLENHRRYIDKQINANEIALQDYTNSTEQSINYEIADRELVSKNNENTMKELQHRLKMSEDKAEHEREIQQQAFDLEKEMLADPV